VIIDACDSDHTVALQVARMHNGELQRGYVHKYVNGHWSIKYVDEVPAQGGSREQVLGEEEVD